MKLPSSLVGISAAALLLAVLGLARLLVTQIEMPEIEVREIETITVNAPPPPPPAAQQEITAADAPPPMALTELSSVADATRVPLPSAEVPLNFQMPIDPFHLDSAPSPLPTASASLSAPISKPAASKISKASPSPPIKNPPPSPVIKSHYSVNELDSAPQLLRHGSAPFPTSLIRKGIKQGTVVFEVEIHTNGAVKILRVISSTHPDLISPARRIASMSRFTSPKLQGQAVKVIKSWPITIQKNS